MLPSSPSDSTLPQPRVVHRKSGDYAAKTGPHSGKTIFERLKHEAKERKERELLRAKMRLEMEREGCTFKPKINANSPHTGTPVARTSSRRTFDDLPLAQQQQEPATDGDTVPQATSPQSNPQSQSPGQSQEEGTQATRGRNFSDQFEEIQRVSSPVVDPGGCEEEDGESARQPAADGRGRSATRGSPRHLQPTISSRSKSPQRNPVQSPIALQLSAVAGSGTNVVYPASDPTWVPKP